MKVITVTAGHSNEDPGAVRGKVTEASIVTELRNIVAHYLREAGVPIRTDGTGEGNLPLRSAIQLIKGSAVAVEFHCNASDNSSARGVEGLSDLRQKAVTQELCAAVNKVLGIPLRGDKGWKAENSGQHSRLGFVSNGGIILELFFISNAAELALWQERKWLVGKAIAEVLIGYSR